MIVKHDKCVVGITCWNKKYDDIAGIVLRKLLQAFMGGDWEYRKNKHHCCVHDSVTSKTIYVWTHKDVVTSRPTEQGTHGYRKTCEIIWHALSTQTTNHECVFSQWNTICVDVTKADCTYSENLCLAHEWQNVWRQASTDDPLAYSDEQACDRLTASLQSILDGVGEDCKNDVREKLNHFQAGAE
eukprot:TRINITY_DN27966_c0_g2_i1.p1 TRINITY_DN27966_c0_g2~~TRINITY_DN27966_c0_g2_i1.p1  ORF type:complete len:185 (+),score=31.43 TRINITY_DN27966_c0_g2_i1:26-580(+)